jgi:membrane fusion protein
MPRQGVTSVSRLFRSEVIEAKRGEWLGTIRLSTPLSHSLLTAAALVIAMALVAFAIVGEYTRRERTAGTLVPNAGLIEIPAPAAGTVARVLVEQGAVVRAGDSVVSLSSDRVSAALGDTAAIVGEQLALQRSRIEADLADQDRLQQEKGAALDERIGTLRAQLAQLDAQRAIQQQQAKNARAMLARFQPLLDRGYVSVLQVQQQEAAALEAEAQLTALARQRLETQQQITEQHDQLEQLPLSVDSQRHEFERKRAEIDQALAQNEVMRAAVLLAPQDGVVSSVMVKAGQAVAAGQIAIALVPKDSLLEAQLLVPSRAIGFVEPGKRVVLRYQAYPYQKFGLHTGSVKTVSRNAMTPQQVSNLFGQQTTEAMYRVEVTLDAQSIEAYGRQEALRPGMALEADILLDRRRLIEWIFEPLYGIGKQVSVNR